MISATQSPAFHARFPDYLELTKPRLSLLSTLTTVAGFFCASVSEITAAFFWMIAGTALCAGGGAVLNQWMEADTDALMARTATRPIPAGRIASGSAFVFGWICCISGLAMLFIGVNGLAASFALATIVIYLGVYTPAKRHSRFSTEIGAVAGALPPLIGWAANDRGSDTASVAWVLFGILFLWQIPHFMAIAWMHRRDYEAVAFPVLAVRDQSGTRVAVYALMCAIALVLVSVSAPARVSWVYLGITVLLGGWLVVCAARLVFSREREQAARRLFRMSLIWLPLQLLALVCCS